MGWVFSPFADATLFWGPTFIAILIYMFPQFALPLAITQFNVFLGDSIVNFGHVWSTAGPLRRRLPLFSAHRIKMIFLPLFYLSCLAAFYSMSASLFMQIIAPIGMTHVFRQQYGWLVLSGRKADVTERDLLIDKILLWTLILAPMIWWLSPLGEGEESHFFLPGDLPHLPSWLALSAFIFYLAVCLLYTLYALYRARTQSVSWGKISLLLSTFFWCASIFFISPRLIFLPALIYIHGLSYIHHSRVDANLKALSRLSPLQYTLVFWFLTSAIGVIWSHCPIIIDYFTHVQTEHGNWLGFIQWIPVSLHYYFDSFIWRRRYV